MAFMGEESAIVSMAGKVQNVKSGPLNVLWLIALDMDNAEREFAFVVLDGRESIAKHVRNIRVNMNNDASC